MLANAKHLESKIEGSFKKPKERVASVASSQDEGEEMPVSSGIDDDVENATSSGLRSYSNRRYRESASNETSNLGSVVTEEGNAIEAGIIQIGIGMCRMFKE